MFSLDRFYNILHNNLISQFDNCASINFYPFGTYDQTCQLIGKFDTAFTNNTQFGPMGFFRCYFFDQEPLYNYTEQIIKKSLLSRDSNKFTPRKIQILANSEKSILKKKFVKEFNFYDWYYFFHGFAALDWYRDFQYIEPTSFNRFDKVFICYNHLTSKLRSYRLHLVSNLIDQDLVKHGHVSLFLKDSHGTWEETIKDAENPLDSRARVKIFHALSKLSEPLIIDTTTPTGSMSASVNFDDLTSALFHVVTETVYFDPKLHLTEKIFKPIVAKRPFILVAAPGNLAYLKSYGFKTFDQWIDESYDEEEDHYIRIEKITKEIAKLCSREKNELEQMHLEMQEILEYNFKHFYTTFKDLIVDELVDNFDHILCQINNGRQPGNHSRYHERYDLPVGYLEEVKKRLKQ